MKRVLLLWIIVCSFEFLHVQTLVPILWDAYDLEFDAPKGLLLEENTEEILILDNSRFYISLVSLDSEDMEKADMPDLLKGLVDYDEVKNSSEVKELELQHFHVAYLKGQVEDESCYMVCMMAKDSGELFYVSIYYNRVEDIIVDKMLKSFRYKRS